MLVVLNRIMVFATLWSSLTSPYARTFFMVHKQKKDEDENKNNMRWITLPVLRKVAKSSTSVDDTTAFRENLVAMVEAASLVECPDEWVLGYKQWDCCMTVVGNWSILLSLRHPSLNITFTLNHLAHFVAMLKDVDDAARLRLLKQSIRTSSGFIS